MIDNNKIKLGFVSSDTLASEKEAKPLKVQLHGLKRITNEYKY